MNRVIQNKETHLSLYLLVPIITINPPPPRGSDPTPLDFSGIISSFITVSTWNLAHLSGHQCGVVSCKENQNRPEIFCYRSNFVTSLHAILGRLKVSVWKFTKNRVFESNANKKWMKHRKARSTKWLSRISYIFFTPKISKNHCFLEKWSQNPKFWKKNQKNRNICCRASGPQPVCKVSTRYDNFWPPKGMCLSFPSAQWWRHTFKCNFLEL